MSKRVLSLVLALVMVLGAFSTVFAAETENEKVAKLVELGLVVGDAGTGDLRLADPIKRSEVSVMIVKALDLGEVANASVTFPSVFKDMSPAHWANGFVNVAAGRGFISGYPDGTFKADNNVNYAEMASMLVRVLNGLTAEEQKTAVWPTTWLAKAAELGLFNGFAVADYNAPATRENVFNMVFNALTAKGSTLLVASTVEGIVVENYRTEALNKDDIIVHVMKDQVAKSESSKDGKKYYEESDEFKVTIGAELKKAGHDVETLLGKVVKVSFDKDGKVVGLEVSKDYDYLQGALTDKNAKNIKLDGKFYTVGKEEARTAFDERLYQVYVNNEDVSYDYFNDNDEWELGLYGEFARITVRNGKVLFIDAFQFEDIAPVAKDIDSKDKVAYYDDVKDGEVKTLTVDKDAYVVNFVDGKMTLGDYKDIAANDVIHWYTQGNKAKTLTVFVRPADDNMVEGKYTEAIAAKAKDEADIKIVVDKEEYKAIIDTVDYDSNRAAVYSTTASEYEFYTLTEDYDAELEPFEKEEVVVLRDMFGKVQLIASEKVDGKFYAVISNTSRSKGEIRLVKADNSNEWFETDRKTKYVNSVGNTQDKEFDYFEKDDLVLATAKDELLTELEYVDHDDKAPIVKLTKDVVDFGGVDNYFYVGKKTVLFDVSGSTPKGMTVADFVKNYDTDKAMEGYVVENTKDKSGRTVDVIVITKATAKDNVKYDTLVVKVSDVRITGKVYRLTVVNPEPSGEKVTYYVHEDDNAQIGAGINKIGKGDVIEIVVPKEADKDGNKEIKKGSIKELIDADVDVFKVLEVGRDRDRSENYMKLKGLGTPTERIVWVSRTADLFGSYKEGSFVAITELNKYNTTFVVDVRKETTTLADWANYEYEDEVVTPDTTAAEVIEAIDSLTVSDPVTQAEVDAVEAARAAFDALTPVNKALVIEDNYADLVAHEAAISAQAIANQNAVNAAKAALTYSTTDAAADPVVFTAAGVNATLTYAIESNDTKVTVNDTDLEISAARGAIDYAATVTVTITAGASDATTKTATVTFKVEVPNGTDNALITKN